jgi:hypothetical protein
LDLRDFEAVSLTDTRIGWLRSGVTSALLLIESAEATIRTDAPFALRGQANYGGTPMSDGIALRLKRVDIQGGGSANLKTSEILFGCRVVRRVLSLSLFGLTSGPAVVSGTIDNPTAALDPKGLPIQAGAARATTGLSLLVGDPWRKPQSSTDPLRSHRRWCAFRG